MKKWIAASGVLIVIVIACIGINNYHHNQTIEATHFAVAKVTAESNASSFAISASNAASISLKQTAQTQSTSAQPNSSQYPPTINAPVYRPYIPFYCTTNIIPYKTIYKNVSYLNVGQTTEASGLNGSIETCTADSTGYKPPDINNQPLDKTVYVGIGPVTYTQSTPTYTYSQAYAYQIALNNCAQYGDTSAYQLCLPAVLHEYGF